MTESPYTKYRKRVALKMDQNTKTEQHHKQSIDINQMISKYHRTGFLPQQPGAFYGDFTSVSDYMQCVVRVRTAQIGFDALPSDIRARFNNDPRYLIQFLGDEKNYDEAIEMGLLQRPNVLKPEPNSDPDAGGGASEQ